jgi:hypothetical protein
VVTISDTAGYKGNIYVEDGGTLAIGQSSIEGDIQIRNGGKVTIRTGATIKGDVRCAGELEIKGPGNLNLYAAKPVADDPETTDINESRMVDNKYIYHGIFIYDDPDVGTGELTLTDSPGIAGDSGRIHTFVSYSHIGGDTPESYEIFCSDHSDVNMCEHWTSVSKIWQKQGDSANE